MDSEKLFQWMAENGVKVSEMANKLGIGHNTLSIYKSRGLPEKKKALAQKIIDTWHDEKPSGITHLPGQGMFDAPIVQISIERNTYTEWQQAGLISENQFTSYAYEKINRFAEKINHTLDELTIEEDTTLHPFQVLTSLAAGSGITSDNNIDEITISKQYPESCKGARVRGDSMESETGISIPDKSIAVIDTEWEGKPFAVKNKIYAWATPEGDMIKKFVRRKVDGKTQGFLVSLNPAYAPIPYDETMIPQGEFVENLNMRFLQL